MTKILLADDSVTIQKVVELTFSEESTQVTSVSDGTAALEKAQLDRPDIIISDVIMPGMNGYEFCQRVKTDPNLKNIPFLFLKGTFESFDEEKAKECGADDFIVKPFESQELIKKVKDLVELQAASAPGPPVTEAPIPVAESATPAPAPPLPESPPPAEETMESFDLDMEMEVDQPAALAASADGISDGAGASQEKSSSEAEVEEDLWSEVSLRSNSSPLIEDKILEDESFWGTGGESAPEAEVNEGPAGEDLLEEVGEPEILDLTEEADPPAAAGGVTPAAPEMADESSFDSVSSEEASPVPAEPPPAPPAEDIFASPFAEEIPPAEAPAAPPADDIFSLDVEASPPSAPPADDIFAMDAEEASAPPAPPADDIFAMDAEEASPPPAPPAEEIFPSAFAEEAPFPEAPQETFVDETPVPAAGATLQSAPAGEAAPRSPGTEDFEKVVGARIESAIKDYLGPVMSEAARKIIEEVAWEVIPDLAEAMIRSEIEKINKADGGDRGA